ncbi:MAG TPA: Smr/MutS family protein [Alphaproteobacteria bacterium]|nr:Smr/MutS family protein [Alphaproteobacteria bacterium]
MVKPKAEAQRPRLKEADLELWAHVTRDTRPLPRRKRLAAARSPDDRGERPEEGHSSAAAAPSRAPRHPAHGPTPPRLPELSLDAAPGLDARSAERLRRGELPIEARLDLHGHSQDEAQEALLAFVERAWHERRRALLVITGKGRRGEGEGVLRAAVPRWLNAAPLRGHLLAFARAQPKDGGAGALYLLLRRQR